MKRFAILLLTVVLLAGQSTLVSANEPKMVQVRELIDTSANRLGSVIYSNVFSSTQVPLSAVLTPRLHSDVPESGLFIPPGNHGMTFYTYIISYKDKPSVYLTEETLDISSLDDLESVTSININYSYAASIVINRYVDNVLHSTKEHFGKSFGDYRNIASTPDFTVNPSHLTVSTEYQNYNFVSSDTDLSEAIIFEYDTPKEINLYYDTNVVEDAGVITIHHVDEDGNLLHDILELTGKIGEPYKINSLIFDNYTLLNDDHSYEGVHGSNDKTYTFTYRLNETAGVIKVHHVDEDGKNLSEPVEFTGEIGSTYEVNALDLKDYTLISDEAMYEGVHSTEDKTYTFTYKLKDVNTKSVIEDTDKPDTIDKNSINKVLPQTGSPNLLYFAVSMLLVGTLLLYFSHRKHQKKV